MPIEHRPPTEATVKNLYANAFRCAHPDCSRPLYKLNDETGERILNSRVAHIHARSEGGPRWQATMSEAANRGAANLLLLCIEHAAEVDDPALEDIFDPDTLRQWKQAQLDEHDEIQRSWPLNDAEVAEVLDRSENARLHAVETGLVALADAHSRRGDE